MRLKLYLEQRDSWGVVTGEERRHETDPLLQPMETIIRGVKGADAQKVCNFDTAKEMWETLTAEKTQRDFSYAVHLKRELYTHSYTPGKKMADYIQEMNSLRQRLQHMGPGFEIHDNEMSQLLLMGNALLSRDEMEKMATDSAANSGAPSCPPPGPGPGPYGPVQTTGAGNRRAIRCYHSRKLGHMRKDCWHYKNKQSKAQQVKSNTHGKEKKKKKDKGGNGDGGGPKQSSAPTTGAMGYMRFVARVDRDEQSSSSSSSESESFVGMAMKEGRLGTSGDWMLDSGTTSHVCIERELFTRLKKSKATFKVWDGGITHGSLCGSVVVTAVDVLSQSELTLMLDNVEFSPSLVQ
ncbi:hypothetical protein PHYSODRAFT_316402 [Phytophthora sojae]|uniref:Retrovirus-related Pol polyprotein from transposon TNT 1-94-like beta-barrel domain-containing protein n=1 Tax=Phytophthora sojae (strain P6497) TaxID=1094619 RepID=G4ZT25_PHYSP|nr:hypothetical protein PHYSODRAFT_316402 [Phytophthora sojae]EGZ12842.1 hypothetical protein PHYSODRAFT_316402 [Phytophthora sojae]|eukprot:XP_009530271.1 hypothetical protein PHYSODRAFT_316402 [Phytophthora sojae]